MNFRREAAEAPSGQGLPREGDAAILMKYVEEPYQLGRMHPALQQTAYELFGPATSPLPVQDW